MARSAQGGLAYSNRLAKVTYPNGRAVFCNYPSSGIGAALSRLDNIAADCNGTTDFVRRPEALLGRPLLPQRPARNQRTQTRQHERTEMRSLLRNSPL